MPIPPERPGLGGSGIDSKWLIGGAVVLAALAYYLYKQNQTNTANATTNPNNPANLNVNANIAPISSTDQYPQNQLVPMSNLALPGTNSNDINQQLLATQTAQQAMISQ